MDSKVTGTPKGASDNGAPAEGGVAKQAAGTSVLEASMTELTGASPSHQAIMADMDVSMTTGVEHESKAGLVHGRTNHRMTPGLRALVDEECVAAKKARVSWQMFAIMVEFTEATEYLSEIHPAVSIYDSVCLREDSPYYEHIIEIARLFSDVGFAVTSGGSPGTMEAANKDTRASRSAGVGLSIELPHEQQGNRYRDISMRFRHFFTRGVMLVKNPDAFIITPGGSGTLGGLIKVLALIQAGKSRSVPVVISGSHFRKDLLDWPRSTLLPMGLIARHDLDIMRTIDEPKDVLDAVYEFCEKCEGTSPIPSKEEMSCL